MKIQNYCSFFKDVSWGPTRGTFYLNRTLDDLCLGDGGRGYLYYVLNLWWCNQNLDVSFDLRIRCHCEEPPQIDGLTWTLEGRNFISDQKVFGPLYGRPKILAKNLYIDEQLIDSIRTTDLFVNGHRGKIHFSDRMLDIKFDYNIDFCTMSQGLTRRKRNEISSRLTSARSLYLNKNGSICVYSAFGEDLPKIDGVTWDVSKLSNPGEKHTIYSVEKFEIGPNGQVLKRD